MSYTQEVKINSVDVSSYIANWNVVKNLDNSENNKAQITLNSDVFSAVTITPGMTLTVNKGATTADVRIFTGTIEKFDYVSGLVNVIGRNPLYNLKFKLITKSYDKNIDSEAGVISAIAEDLITNESYGNLNGSVTASGSITTLDKFICNDDNILERLQTLAKILNWQVYWDDINEQVVFEPKGNTTYGTTLTVGGYIQNIPKWEVDLKNMRNKFKVKGASRRDWKVENFNGDAAETVFTLIKTPKDTEIYVDSVLQIRGLTGSTETFDYTVDEDQKEIQFEAGSTPGVGVNNVVINYSYDIPVPVVARNQLSIDTYKLKEGSQYFDDVRTISDAEIRARQIIARIGIPFNRTTLQLTGIFDLKVGNKVHVVDSLQNKDVELTVQNITYKYPDGNDVVRIGDEDFDLNLFLSTIAARVKELEKREVTNQDILTNIFELNRTTNFERRYEYLETRDTTEDSIWGRGFGNGVSDSLNWNEAGALWQASYTNSLVITKMVQGKNTYKEFFYDDDFEDSGSTTADWDTANKWCVFDAGEILQTSSLTLGTTYSFFTINLASVTGTLTPQISMDGGSTWQSVTLGLRTAFDHSGTEVLLKITESGASTAKIENTYNSDGSYNKPGIKILLEE